MFDSIVIGGGPAGLTAAFYLGRAGRTVLLLERDALGGQARVIETIENIPGAPQLPAMRFIENLVAQAKKYDVRVVFEEAHEVRIIDNTFHVITSKHSYEGQSLICATGARFRSLETPGTSPFLGKGVFFCPTPREAEKYTGKTVAVLGGGDSAFDRALLLSRFAKQVHLIYRALPRALPLLQKQVKNTPSILCHAPYELCSLHGSPTLRSIQIQHVQKPKIHTLPVDALFSLIGKDPNDQLFPVNRGAFVCGDALRGRSRQVTIACGDAMQVAMDCDEYLHSYAYC